MSNTLSREMLAAAFSPDELVKVPEINLGIISDADSREVLKDLGVPVLENPWFDLDGRIRERFERVSDWDGEISDRFSDAPAGVEEWISLGMIPYDDIAFDPSTGRVFCLSDEAGIYLLNSTLRSFVHFLYLLQIERPHYDFESDGDLDLAGARSRTEEAMRTVDPAALETSESRWFDVLQYIEDPSSHY